MHLTSFFYQLECHFHARCNKQTMPLIVNYHAATTTRVPDWHMR